MKVSLGTPHPTEAGHNHPHDATNRPTTVSSTEHNRVTATLDAPIPGLMNVNGLRHTMSESYAAGSRTHWEGKRFGSAYTRRAEVSW